MRGNETFKYYLLVTNLRLTSGRDKMGSEKEEKKKKDSADIFDILNLRIAGIDIGKLIRNLTGTDLQSIINNPSAVEELRNRLEKQRDELRRQQEELRKRFGDAVRIDYDIRIGGILGGERGLRVGGGDFFTRLDELARERAQWRTRYGKPLLSRRIETPTKEEVREPLVDLFEEEGEIIVIAELPGVPEADIEVKKTEEGLLQIKAGNKFYKELKIPVEVDYEKMAKRYNNGVLEIKLPKTD